MKSKYINISIREDLALQVDKKLRLIKPSFPSRASLVVYLLRNWLSNEEKKIKSKDKGYV